MECTNLTLQKNLKEIYKNMYLISRNKLLPFHLGSAFFFGISKRNDGQQNFEKFYYTLGYADHVTL